MNDPDFCRYADPYVDPEAGDRSDRRKEVIISCIPIAVGTFIDTILLYVRAEDRLTSFARFGLIILLDYRYTIITSVICKVMQKELKKRLIRCWHLRIHLQCFPIAGQMNTI
jgi:hypothetical protein